MQTGLGEGPVKEEQLHQRHQQLARFSSRERLLHLVVNQNVLVFLAARIRSGSFNDESFAVLRDCLLEGVRPVLLSLRYAFCDIGIMASVCDCAATFVGNWIFLSVVFGSVSRFMHRN
jgi:hypothetical protein